MCLINVRFVLVKSISFHIQIPLAWTTPSNKLWRVLKQSIWDNSNECIHSHHLWPAAQIHNRFIQWSKEMLIYQRDSIFDLKWQNLEVNLFSTLCRRSKVLSRSPSQPDRTISITTYVAWCWSKHPRILSHGTWPHSRLQLKHANSTKTIMLWLAIILL